MTNLTWLPDAAWRGALLLVFAFLLARLLRAQSAAVRHVLWTGALAGVMAMPILAIVAPPVPVAVPPRVRSLSSPVALEKSLGGAEFVTVEVTGEPLRDVATPSAATGSSSLGSAIEMVTTPWYRKLSPVTSAIILWLAGVALLSIRLAAGFVALRRMGRNGRDAVDSVAELADACAARLGLHDTPRVIVSSRVAMPCTAGWIRPVILLPEGYETWSQQRLEVVLLHEISHIRRMDIVPHLLSEFARVIYWFNPLVWVAAARLRAEAEMATDDRVVHAGARPSDYAAHLLDIVRQSRRIWHPAPLMPLARRSEFEGRMLAILESGGALANRRWALGTLALIGALSLGVAAVEAAAPRGNDDLAGQGTVESVTDNEVETQEAPEEPLRGQSPGASPRMSASQSAASLALAEALRDPVAAVRQAAAEALGSARDSVAVRALMEVLRNDDSPTVRRAAAWSLGEIGDALAIPALTDALSRDRDAETRKNAAAALGHIDSPRATDALSQALERDADVSVRIEAAEALANIEDPAATEVLIRVLENDDDPGVRRAVIEAIDNIDGARAVPAVSRALRDNDVAVRRAAAEALGSMDDNDAVPALMAAARDEDTEVRKAVIHSLSSLGDRRALSSFVAALSDASAEVRYYAAEGIGNMENLRTAPAELIRAMDDRDAEVRHAVAHALGHIEDPAAIRVLVAHVSDPSVEVRQAVVESLDQFDDPSVTSALRTALKDPDAEVREQAAKALGNRNRSK